MDERSVVDDLADEYAALDEVVAALDGPAWDAPTPSPGWVVRDQLFHLAFGDDLAALAATDPAAFGRRLEELIADLDALDTHTTSEARRLSPAEILAKWRGARDTLLPALQRADGSDRIGWITGPMSVRSFATARLMETWAHGRDVLEAVGVRQAPTDRLRHIAHLGVATRAFSFRNRGLDVPDGDVRVELTAPSGETWAWGESTTDVVRGPAEDFCLVVTQRTHRADTALEIEGPHATAWMAIAQIFAGPATDGPAPRASAAST